ncbi:MAG: polysaccharide deacetylase family protein [Acidobacteria bacterium]|nr:polysaccharide deacetylase family protein [Acidobacteriota bacterium]
MRAISLEYHDVVRDGEWQSSGLVGPGANSYKLSDAEFRTSLEAISRNNGETPVLAEHLLETRQERLPLLLTFDDGGIGAWMHAADILDEFGWKGHFFVIANRIGSVGFLQRDHIRELRQRGHVIGSHSYSHPQRMAALSGEAIYEEWRRSAEELSEVLGEAIETASIPGGYYSRGVAAAAARAGYRFLFTSEPVTEAAHFDDCLVLGRFTARPGYPPEWFTELAAGSQSRILRERLHWDFKKGLKRILGPTWLPIRAWLVDKYYGVAGSATESIR